MTGKRVPIKCPPAFQGRYTVQQGDTMFFISKRYSVPLQDLIDANPHITNPNLIYPGDILCVPEKEIDFPCLFILEPQVKLPPNAAAVVFIQELTWKEYGISILAAYLPPPSSLGNFDTYVGEIIIPRVNGFGTELLTVTVKPPALAGSFNVRHTVRLTRDSEVRIKPFNTKTGIDGPVIFSGTLKVCMSE